jgi:ubiquinone/menaquinone biosynthesis C-methylase UbiE
MAEPSADDQHGFEIALAYENVVVPRYARVFADLLLRAVDIPARANILDLSCRTGIPSVELVTALNEGRIVAIDPEGAFLELARARGGSEVGRRLFFKQEGIESLPFSNEVFTNVVGNLIDRATTDRGSLLAESARVIRPGGQLVLTMPLRGSFNEVLDIFREVALKHDLGTVADRVDQYAVSMPTREMWQTEVESRGFSSASIEIMPFTLAFESGEHLMSDPAILVAAMPEWQWCAAAVDDPGAVLYWVQDAVDTYFRGRLFEVTVNAGCVAARRQR